jgi:putative ubiquitin-RnfH superfamily antitoxin RatB of RatAB toxin-antitoxin module
MEKNERISVEVAYALPQNQRLIEVQVNVGATALDAVLLSGIAGEFPEIDPATANMGIFSKALDGKTLPLPQDYRLKARDRVEIYRPLTIDPKEARLARAQKAKAQKAKAQKAKAEKAKAAKAVKQPTAGN